MADGVCCLPHVCSLQFQYTENAKLTVSDRLLDDDVALVVYDRMRS